MFREGRAGKKKKAQLRAGPRALSREQTHFSAGWTGVQSTRVELGMALGVRKPPIRGPFLPILAPGEEEGSPGACPPMAGDGGAPWDSPVDTELQVPLAPGHPGIAPTAAPHPAMRQALAPDCSVAPFAQRPHCPYRYPEATPVPSLEP